MKKKFLVVGAGNWQNSGIKKLTKSGYDVHLTDTRNYLLKNYEKIHKHKIKLLKISEFLELIKKHKIKNCISFNSDFAVPIINLINKELGKNFYKPKIISIFTKKIAFRNFQKKNNLNHPFFLTNHKKIFCYKNYNSNFLIKPNTASGSKGIFKLNKFTEKKKFIKYFNTSKNISFDNKVIFESTIPGKEYGGNCYLSNRIIIDLRITKKFVQNNIVIGHVYPSGLSLDLQNKIKDELLIYFKKLNIKNSIINFDLKIYKNKIYILELALRGGANGITEIIKYATNFDYEKIVYEKKLDKLRCDNFYYNSYVFGSKFNGYLKSLKFNLNNCSFVLKKTLFPKKNDKVFKFKSNDLSIGMIIFKTKRISDFYNKKKFFEKKIELTLKK